MKCFVICAIRLTLKFVHRQSVCLDNFSLPSNAVLTRLRLTLYSSLLLLRPTCVALIYSFCLPLLSPFVLCFFSLCEPPLTIYFWLHSNDVLLVAQPKPKFVFVVCLVLFRTRGQRSPEHRTTSRSYIADLSWRKRLIGVKLRPRLLQTHVNCWAEKSSNPTARSLESKKFCHGRLVLFRTRDCRFFAPTIQPLNRLQARSTASLHRGEATALRIQSLALPIARIKKISGRPYFARASPVCVCSTSFRHRPAATLTTSSSWYRENSAGVSSSVEGWTTGGIEPYWSLSQVRRGRTLFIIQRSISNHTFQRCGSDMRSVIQHQQRLRFS